MVDRKRKQEGQVYPIFAKKAKQEKSAAGPSSMFSPSEVPSSEATPALSLTEFSSLLDFSGVDTEEEITCRLDRIPRALFHDFRLVARRADAKETEFQVVEAEFYLQVEACHEDPFTHGSEEQKVSGRWYFHRAPRRSEDSHRSATSTTSYRSGSRKGMDLTFGGPPLHKSSKLGPTDPTTSTDPSNPQKRLLRGGILLRSLRQLGPGGKIISGPSLLVDQILNVSGASSIEDLVDNKWERNTSAFLSEDENAPTCLYLKSVESANRKSLSKIYFSPRIGLDLSHPGTTGPAKLPLHPRIQFLKKAYRFFIQPDQLVANGRAQTFLGVLHSCVSSSPSLEAGLKRPSLSSEIARTTGLKEATAAKYLIDYLAGRKAGANFVETVIGPKGKGASSSPATYLRMMGALSTL